MQRPAPPARPAPCTLDGAGGHAATAVRCGEAAAQPCLSLQAAAWPCLS